jgi:phosphoglycerol transferase MdoB-like AlkP superfamily enzyme
MQFPAFRFFFRLYLLWLFLFAVSRLIFLLWNIEEWWSAGVLEAVASFVYGLYLDTSMSGYFMALPWLMVVVHMWTQQQIWLTLAKVFTALWIIILGWITIGELPVYDEWHHKLTFKAIWFLGNPLEVIHTASWWQLGLGIPAVIAFSFFGIRLYNRRVHPEDILPRAPWWKPVVTTLLMPPLLMLAIRGGVQQIPANVSDAYYSNNNALNLTSVNSAFHLAASILENTKGGEPYAFMKNEEADAIVDSLYTNNPDSTLSVLSVQRPNIVLVVLESWSADLVKSCGGYDSITPFFDSIAQHGILFSDCYASGGLSDQGMAAIFSGFPAQPRTSIITQPNKYPKLPCINKELKKAGYRSSFLFGGQLSYGNIRSYMYFNEFDKIIEGDDFDDSIPQGKLGVADEYLFRRQLQEVKGTTQPFFAAMFTLSSHGPFDFPMKHELNWGGKEKDYINSVLYVDRCLKEFIHDAKKQPWYNNTLFVFVSDHSHNSPKNWAFNDPRYRRIPMLLFGEVLKPEYRGWNYAETVSQTDLATTLLTQLQLPSKDYVYSKDVFNRTTKHFAFFAFEEGMGWIEPDRYITWWVDGRVDHKKFIQPSDSLQLGKRGQAYLQRVMNDYWSF